MGFCIRDKLVPFKPIKYLSFSRQDLRQAITGDCSVIYRLNIMRLVKRDFGWFYSYRRDLRLSEVGRDLVKTAGVEIFRCAISVPHWFLKAWEELNSFIMIFHNRLIFCSLGER